MMLCVQWKHQSMYKEDNYNIFFLSTCPFSWKKKNSEGVKTEVELLGNWRMRSRGTVLRSVRLWTSNSFLSNPNTSLQVYVLEWRFGQTALPSWGWQAGVGIWKISITESRPPTPLQESLKSFYGNGFLLHLWANFCRSFSLGLK